MNQKKNKKIIIMISIIIILVLVLILGGVYAYVATDTFKGNKELFFKYLTQIGDEKNGFIENSLKEYSEKKKNTPYTNKGSFNVHITAQNGQDQFEKTNNMNITFDGQVDNTTKKMQENISLNYSDSVKFPIVFKRIDNIAGVQTDNIGSKFITIDLSSDNSSIDKNNEIEKIQDLKEVPFNQEEFKNIFNKYMQIINSELKESSFSKIEEQNSRGYKLTLTGEELENITIKVLEIFKNDGETLDKINEYLKKQKNSLKLTASDIDLQIDNIRNNNALDEKTIEITVYQKQAKTNSISVKIDDTEIKLEKILTGNDLKYILNIQTVLNEKIQKGTIVAKYQGLQAMQSITENYEIELEEKELKYQYNYNNDINFSSSSDSNIEEFNDNNSLNLSELEKEQRSVFIEAVTERIKNLNKKQMEKLGVEEGNNPLLYAVPQMEIYSNTGNLIDPGDLDQAEIATYNQKFELYESTNLKGVTVKGLLTSINLNNETQERNDRKIKEIHFDGEEYEATEQNITIIKSNVELETAYRVEFEKDETTRSNL